MIDDPIEIKITSAHLWSVEMSRYVTSPLLFARSDISVPFPFSLATLQSAAFCFPLCLLRFTFVRYLIVPSFAICCPFVALL